MVLGGSRQQAELDRTLKQLVTRQKAIDKRVERLETLEFDQKSIGQGCVAFVDSDFSYGAGKATFHLDMPALLPSGNQPYSQASIFWALASTDESNLVNLHMQVNAVVGATYDFAYKFTKGGALTQVGLGGQTSWIIGRVAGFTRGQARGRITIPFAYDPSSSFDPSAFGDWTTHDTAGGANNKQEKGEWGGTNTFTAISQTQFDIFAAAGNLFGFAYLYAWCPEGIPGGGPDD